MRAVITRVSKASVSIDGVVHGAIDQGFLVLLGVTHEDTAENGEKLARKICNLRVFGDDAGQMNRSLSDISGALLVISQFTLYGNCKKGKRPDFLQAARPDQAIPLYEGFVAACKAHGFPVETGQFGANMQVHSTNDGPVTFIIDTDTL